MCYILFVLVLVHLRRKEGSGSRAAAWARHVPKLFLRRSQPGQKRLAFALKFFLQTFRAIASAAGPCFRAVLVPAVATRVRIFHSNPRLPSARLSLPARPRGIKAF